MPYMLASRAQAPSEREPVPVSIDHLPLAVTFALFGVRLIPTS